MVPYNEGSNKKFNVESKVLNLWVVCFCFSLLTQRMIGNIEFTHRKKYEEGEEGEQNGSVVSNFLGKQGSKKGTRKHTRAVLLILPVKCLLMTEPEMEGEGGFV